MPDPLAGVRVIDFTWVLAGPQATRILADFGADVIKVESPFNRDEARDYGPKPAGYDPLDPNPDVSGYFINFNRSKRGITLNLKNPEGMALLRRLIAVSDVVIENFRAGVMRRFGLDYEGLCAVRPDIIYLSMAGFGHAGPDAERRLTYGSTVQALSGLNFVAGLPGRKHSGWGHAVMDHFGGYNAVIALLIALYHRRRTGRGQYIDLSQVQAATTLLGQFILNYTVNGMPNRREGMPFGNDLPWPPSSPHGVYPCARPDTWVAIAVVADEQWAGFRRALGDPEWARDPRFAGGRSRYEHRREIDRHVAEWTSLRDRHWIATRLQDHGVPAYAVQGSPDLARDPQLAARSAYVTLDQPPLGPFVFDGIPAQLSRTPGHIRRPAPRLSEHTREVCRELLGIDDGEFERLRSAGAFS